VSAVIPSISALSLVVGGLDLIRGPFLAGGAARSLVNDDPVVDFDLFFASQEQADIVTARLLSAGGEEVICDDVPSVSFVDEAGVDHPIRSTYYAVPRVGRVNIARTHVFRDIAALFLSFDFTCCMVATDGRLIVADPRALTDIRDRVLRPTRDTLPHRVAKYIAKGYRL
jgi:hypothetical protein